MLLTRIVLSQKSWLRNAFDKVDEKVERDPVIEAMRDAEEPVHALMVHCRDMYCDVVLFRCLCGYTRATQ